MDSMKELKDWLVTKCRLPGFQHTLRLPEAHDSKFISNIMTPMSIPEFVIPGSQDSSRNASICSSDDLRSHSSGMSVSCSPCTSPAVSPRNSLAGLAVPDSKSPVRVRSAPVSPRRDSHGFLRDFGARSLSISLGQQGAGRDTGGSGADMAPTGNGSDSAPFLRIHRSSNSLGGSLKDCPRSRRRDSQNSISSGGGNYLKTEQCCEPRNRRGFMRRPFRSHECLASPIEASGASGAGPEHSCLSATSSPRRCSPVFTDQNDYLPLRESFRRSQRYYRRRSSLAQVEMTTALWRQQAEASGRWPGGGEGGSPRRLPTSLLSAPHPLSLNLLKRHSAPSTTMTPAAAADPSSISSSQPSHSSSSQAHEACSSGVLASPAARDAPPPDLGSGGGVGLGSGGRGGGGSTMLDVVEADVGETAKERLPAVSVDLQNGGGGVGGGEVAKTATERGDIKFSFQYFPATRRLKLLLIRAENLHFPERPDIVTNPFFKVYLMPGKLQKQTSETVKHSRNPVYNREFFFNDINMEELRNLRLRIKAFHKSQNLKLAEYLGEVNIPLVNYDLLMENRMWNDLHFKPYEQDLGHLQVELLLEPREERLTVGVLQAKGLPSHNITGPPDPYVCVTIEQCGRVVEERLTRSRKKTCDPVFRENFEVRLSCGHEDLRDTRLRFRVYDHGRLRSDPVLGEVWLGRGAREESVITHWQEMSHAPGRKLRRWHYILSAGETVSS